MVGDRCCCLHRCHGRGDNSQRGFCIDCRKSLNTAIRKGDCRPTICHLYILDSGCCERKVLADFQKLFSYASDPIASSSWLGLSAIDKAVILYVKTEHSLWWMFGRLGGGCLKVPVLETTQLSCAVVMLQLGGKTSEELHSIWHDA